MPRRATPELRESILTAAAALLLERGSDFSMRLLAERIGRSATTIYLHFEDKDDLLRAVLAEGFERFLRALEAVATADPAGQVADLGRAYVRFGLANRAFYQLMFMRRMDLMPRTQPTAAPSSFQVLVQAVDRAIVSGAFRPGDAYLYSLVIWAAVHGVVALAVASTAIPDEMALAMGETMVELTTNGVRA